MTMFEKRSDETAYADHGSHQQRAGVSTAGNVMSTWTVAFYDYADQVLKAQRQFANSMLGIGAPMLDVARDVMSPEANKDRSANNQLDARNDQGHDGSHRSRKNERYNDDDTSGYNNRSVDHDMSESNTSDTSRTERANTETEESTKTRAPGATSATARKRP